MHAKNHVLDMVQVMNQNSNNANLEKLNIMGELLKREISYRLSSSQLVRLL